MLHKLQWIFLISLLVIFMGSMVGRARGQSVLSPDPAGTYRMIGPAAAGTGPAVCAEPLCALESLLACFARRDEILCRRVWPRSEAAGMLFTPGTRNYAYWWSYRIEAVTQISGGQLDVAVEGRHCGLITQPANCQTEPPPATIYRLQRTPGGAWQIVDWRTPSDELK